MTIHWEALLEVFAVSFGSTVVVVALVTVGILGLSARNAPAVSVAPTGLRTRPERWSPATGTAVAGTGLGLAALIVLVGLWEIVAR